MAWFKNMKIGVKLFSGFGLIILRGLIGFYSAVHALQNYISDVTTFGNQCREIISKSQEFSIASSNMARETKAYANAPSTEHWDAKFKYDDDAGKAFEAAKNSMAKMPDNKEITDAMTAANDQDANICNPLENKILNLVKEGKAAEGRKVLTEQYVPARSHLEELVNTFESKLQSYSKSLSEKETDAAHKQITFGWYCQLLVVGFSGLLAFLIVRSVTIPVTQISKGLDAVQAVCLTNLGHAMDALAQGDLTSEIVASTKPIEMNQQDEFGQMAKTFNNMLSRAQSTIRAFAVAQDNLRVIVGEVSKSANNVAYSSISLVTSTERTSSAAGQITQAMEEVSQAASQSATTSQEMASGSEQLARAASDAAASMDRLQAAVAQVQSGGASQQSASFEADQGMQTALDAVAQMTNSAKNMAETAQLTAEVAHTGSSAVEQTIQSMNRIQEQVKTSAERVKELGEKGQEIGAIVETIDQIAEQTNLLALNAAIEAARAGEHGKGFAVVADEVRKLAERSALATREIGNLISGVRAGVEQAVYAMETSTDEVTAGAARSTEAGNALQQILEAVEHVTVEVGSVNAIANKMHEVVGMVQESVSALKEASEQSESAISDMAREAQLISGAITTVASISQETAAGAEEMSASAQEVSASSQNVAAAVRTQSASIAEVGEATDQLTAMGSHLKEVVSQFKLDSAHPTVTETSAASTLRKAA